MKRWLKLQIIVSEQFKSLTRLWPSKPKKTLNFKYFFYQTAMSGGADAITIATFTILFNFFKVIQSYIFSSETTSRLESVKEWVANLIFSNIYIWENTYWILLLWANKVHTRAFSTRAMNCMHLCLCKHIPEIVPMLKLDIYT